MKLSELSKLDIKDLQKIDYNQLGKEVTKRPDYIIIAVSIIMTLFLSLHFFSKNRKMASALKLEVQTLEDKVAVIEEYTDTKAELTALQDAIPEPLTQEGLINLVSDFAFKRNLQISSLTPGQTEEEKYHDVISVHVQIESSDFKNIWLFVHDIESSKLALRVDEWRGSRGSSTGSRSRRRPSQANINRKMNFQIQISVVNLKNV